MPITNLEMNTESANAEPQSKSESGSYFSSFLASTQAILRYLTSNQVKGLFYLGLLAGAAGVRAAASSTAKDKVVNNIYTQPTEDMMSGIYGEPVSDECLQSIVELEEYFAEPETNPEDEIMNFFTQFQGHTILKPDDMAFGIYDAGNIVPEPCKEPESDACHQALTELAAHLAKPETTQRINELQGNRGEENAALGQFQRDFNQRKKALNLKLTPKQQAIENTILNNLAELIVSNLKHGSFIKSGGGNCGEFTKFSLIELLKLRIKLIELLKLYIKMKRYTPEQIDRCRKVIQLLDNIQIVWVSAKATQEEIDSKNVFLSKDPSGRTPPKVNHNFLLFGNGKAFDIWQRKSCNLNEAGCELYNHKRWKFEYFIAKFFAELDQMPTPFQVLICDSLDEIELVGVEENNVCETLETVGLWQRKKTTKPTGKDVEESINSLSRQIQ